MATDYNLSQLTAATSLDDTDLLYLMRDPSGTPLDRVISYLNMKSSLKTYMDTLYHPMRGYLQENSAQLSYVGTQAYDDLPGCADVNGTLLTWAANISRTSLPLTANTLYYVYLYSNGGLAAIEESITAPVWDSTLNYYKKTGDATRRCIGFIEASATNTIRKFIAVASGRNLETFYNDGVINPDRILVNSQASTTNWTPINLAPLAPAHATHVNLVAKLMMATLGDDGIVGLNPTDLGTGVSANSGINFYRGRASSAGANVFFGAAWFPMVTSQAYYPASSEGITSGIGWTGMANLQRYVEEGGTLITLSNGSALALGRGRGCAGPAGPRRKYGLDTRRRNYRELSRLGPSDLVRIWRDHFRLQEQLSGV